MDIKQIKELLENPQIKELVEAEIVKAVAEKQAELDSLNESLSESKKKAEKELFLHKKMLVAKSTLYEKKLKALKDAEFEAATKKLSSDVFEFINESITKLTAAVAEESKGTLQTTKIAEAFSQAARIMAPYMNINELAESTSAVLEDYKKKLNSAKLEIQDLRSKVLADDVTALVVKECTGYPLEKQTVVVQTLKKLAPKTLTEAKSAIEKIKHELRTKAEETVVTENAAGDGIVFTESRDEARARLSRLAAVAKSANAKAIQESVSQKSETLDPEEIFNL